MKKIVTTIISIFLLFWGTTAYYGTKSMYNNFDKALVEPDTQYSRLDYLENISDPDSIKLIKEKNWVFRKCYAVLPFLIYFRFAVKSERIGGVAGQGLAMWFFGYESNLWNSL
jgi:hypothetical protein